MGGEHLDLGVVLSAQLRKRNAGAPGNLGEADILEPLLRKKRHEGADDRIAMDARLLRLCGWVAHDALLLRSALLLKYAANGGGSRAVRRRRNGGLNPPVPAIAALPPRSPASSAPRGRPAPSAPRVPRRWCHLAR